MEHPALVVSHCPLYADVGRSFFLTPSVKRFRLPRLEQE